MSIKEEYSVGLMDFRKSIQSIRKSIQSVASLQADYEYSRACNEKRWKLSYLKKQFEKLQLQSLFHRYTQRISHGYFSQFLSLQIILSTIHFIAVLSSNIWDPMMVLPDLIIYGFVIFISILCLIVTDMYVKEHPKLLSIFTSTMFLILFFMNIFIPFYGMNNNFGKLRPAYTTHIIIAVYVFLNVRCNILAFCLGLFVSIVHIVMVVLLIYYDSEMMWERIVSDVLYLSCINGVGIYFRYMNEIVKRRSFLDRRSCVESTLQVQFEQKQESDLMASIIPKHIIDEVKDEFKLFWEQIESSTNPPTHLPFENPYLENHDNVSILFADIVNYTWMTTQLNINELISILNELFSRFDEASEKLNVLRIKFLGDCYYCVAGLPPDPAPNHAEACVDLGLQMINIIAEVRKRSFLNIDMRIGIHSGKITSGIIGNVKWQYDIWSNDVDLANKMETEGQPGRVHITEHTKNLLKKSYDIAPFKTVNNIRTYLIAPAPVPEIKKKYKDEEQIYMNYDIDISQSTPQFTKNNNLSLILRPSNLSTTNSIRSMNSNYSVDIQDLYEKDYSRRSTAHMKKSEISGRSSVSSNYSVDIQALQNNINETRRSTHYKRNLGSRNGSLSGIQTENETEQNNEHQRRPTIYKKRNTVSKRNNSLPIEIQNNIHNLEIEKFEEAYNRRSTITGNKKSIPNGYDRKISGNPSLTLSHKIEKNRNLLPRRLTGGKKREEFIYNIKIYEDMLKSTSEILGESIENLLLSKYEQWFQVMEMNRIFLTFKNWKHELSFIKLRDPLFKYYVLGSTLLLIIVYMIENLTLSKWDWMSIPFYVAISIMIFIFLPLTWTQYFWMTIHKEEGAKPQNKIMKLFFNISKSISYNVFLRIFLYTIICILFCLCVLIELIECEIHEHNGVIFEQRSLISLWMRRSSHNAAYCIIPWHMTDTCTLAIIMSFIFLRMYMWVKFIYASLIAIVYSISVWAFSDRFYKNQETLNYKMKPQLAHVIAVVFITIILHLIDRQTEYMNRLDHSWYETLVEKQKKATSIRALNKLLLENILPKHIAEQHLDMTHTQTYEPESYPGVAVMFASLVDYSVEEMGGKFLEHMNEIICSFDLLTAENSFGRPIEKIKIAKWTYMAACGLAPGLGDVENIYLDRQAHPVISLIKFAAKLIQQLQKINESNGQYMQQDIKLRIGISYGPIAAGVVGSKKPLYDIWGHPVNMASRMDSSGERNRIQVLSETAEIIQEFGYKCEYRGAIKIKGPKLPVDTYFVCLDENFELVRL